MIGQTISHYKITEKLGEGGMGEVYLAEDTSLKRKVALKFLPDYLQQDEVAQKRFLREAQSAAALDHPFICKIFETGEEEGQSFIAMEYIKGQTLKEKLLEGPVPLKQTLQIGMEIAEALEEAHKAGIAHRDLKPANIMLTSGGHVKVMDFGLAKKVVDEDGTEQDITSALTREGTTLGTIAYMAPEQLRGKTVDTRSDIFSFGIVLYELLSGVHPFRKPKQVETTNAILSEDPSPLSRYTEDTADLLQHTVEKMLAKDAEERYQSVREVRTNLKKLSEKVTGPVDVVPPPPKSKRGIWLGVGAVLVVLVGIFLGKSFYELDSVKVEEETIDSVAVLPFVALTEDEDCAALARGIPSAISSSLSRLSGLTVRPTSVLRHYEARDVDPRTVGDEQSVRAVLVGTVERRSEDLVVDVNLIHAKDNSLIWGRPYNRPFSEIFAIQEDITRQVVEALRLELTDKENENLAQSGSTNPGAYQAFLMGNHSFDRWATGADYKVLFANAIRHYEKAVEIDPNYQRAYFSLYRMHFNRARTTTLSQEDRDQARGYLEKLIAADDSTALAHVAKARLLWQWEREWAEAEQEYLRASELDPSFKVGSWFLEWMGRLDELRSRAAVNVEQMDLMNANDVIATGYDLIHLRQYEKAIELANIGLELEPDSRDGYGVIFVAYQLMGMKEKAFEALMASSKAWGLTEEDLAVVREIFRNSGTFGVEQWLREFTDASSSRPEINAGKYSQLGSKEKAFEWLEISWANPLWGTENAPHSPYWDPLRRDPRFEELLRKQNLPEEAIQRHLALPSR